MAFPEDILTEDEDVVSHLRPHWRQLARPMMVPVVGVAAMMAGWMRLPQDDTGQLTLYGIGAVVLAAVLWLSVWPWLVWRNTHYVFTTERVVLVRGVLRRERRDIPLHRVNNHLMSQRLVDRMYGCGTVTIESAGQEGQTELVDVPHVQRVQTMLYELVDADRDRFSMGDSQFRAIMQELGKDGAA